MMVVFITSWPKNRMIIIADGLNDCPDNGDENDVDDDGSDDDDDDNDDNDGNGNDKDYDDNDDDDVFQLSSHP